jgi:hypothetical protein
VQEGSPADGKIKVDDVIVAAAENQGDQCRQVPKTMGCHDQGDRIGHRTP